MGSVLPPDSAPCAVPLLFATVLVALSWLAACRSEPSIEEPDTRSDPFTIVMSPHDALPDVPPGLDGDTLVVRVQYEGGCADHDFSLSQAQRGDTTLLSVRHRDGGDGCDESVYDELKLALPEDFRATGPVLLRNPQGGEPFRLR